MSGEADGGTGQLPAVAAVEGGQVQGIREQQLVRLDGTVLVMFLVAPGERIYWAPPLAPRSLSSLRAVSARIGWRSDLAVGYDDLSRASLKKAGGSWLSCALCRSFPSTCCSTTRSV